MAQASSEPVAGSAAATVTLPRPAWTCTRGQRPTSSGRQWDSARRSRWGTGEREADAKSLLSVLALGAKAGTEIRLTAVGDDADAAITALRERVATLS